jgi:hypothetical protein
VLLLLLLYLLLAMAAATGRGQTPKDKGDPKGGRSARRKPHVQVIPQVACLGLNFSKIA